MATFRCTGCGAQGDLLTLDLAQRCPSCGSPHGIRITLRMDDYPKGHPFWDEFSGAPRNDEQKPTKVRS